MKDAAKQFLGECVRKPETLKIKELALWLKVRQSITKQFKRKEETLVKIK